MHAGLRNHSRHAMPHPMGYPRRTDLCDVKACAHSPGNTVLTTEYWRSCEYTDDAALPTLGKAFLYIMYQLRVAGDAVRTVFSVSRRPLQALEGCLARCCCSTTPTALRLSAAAKSDFVFANGSRRVQRGVAKCKAPRGEASRLVPVLVPRRCDDHFIPFIPSSIITRSNAAQALEYITLPAGLRGVPYNLLVEAAILKQVFTSCFGLHKSTCNLIRLFPTIL